MNRVQLFSGGLDSLCLWVLMGKPRAVYVLTDHAYQVAEIGTISLLRQQVRDLAVEFLAGPPIGHLELPDGHVPHRNLNLLATAAAYTGADQLVLGALLGEASPDKSRRFLRTASRALTASEGKPVQVIAPAARLTKTQLLRRALAVEPRLAEWLPLTRSCYDPALGECGYCQACFRRQVALYRSGLSDERPKLPPSVLANGRKGLRQAGVRRLPAIAANNAGAALALAGIRRR